jgi:hypothetical protein
LRLPALLQKQGLGAEAPPTRAEGVAAPAAPTKTRSHHRTQRQSISRFRFTKPIDATCSTRMDPCQAPDRRLHEAPPISSRASAFLKRIESTESKSVGAEAPPTNARASQNARCIRLPKIIVGVKGESVAPSGARARAKASGLKSLLQKQGHRGLRRSYKKRTYWDVVRPLGGWSGLSASETTPHRGAVPWLRYRAQVPVLGVTMPLLSFNAMS